MSCGSTGADWGSVTHRRFWQQRGSRCMWSQHWTMWYWYHSSSPDACLVPLQACYMSSLDSIHYTTSKLFSIRAIENWISFFSSDFFFGFISMQLYLNVHQIALQTSKHTLKPLSIQVNEWLCWSSEQKQGLLLWQYFWLMGAKFNLTLPILYSIRGH